METLKNTIFSGWHFMRWFRLVMGLVVAYQAYEMQNGLLGLLAGFFIFQALANTGCCASSACSPRPSRRNTNDIHDVEFEEIKNK